MENIVEVLVVGTVVGLTLFLVARRSARLLFATRRLQRALERPTGAGEDSCSCCKLGCEHIGPVFEMRAVGLQPAGMPDVARVVVPMCPECHIEFIRFDLRCSILSLGWCLSLIAAVAVLVPAGMLDLTPNDSLSLLTAYFLLPAALNMYLVTPRYYKAIIGHPAIVRMKQMGYLLAVQDRFGNYVERCDWKDIVGSRESETVASCQARQKGGTPQLAGKGLGRRAVLVFSLMMLTLSAGPAIVKFVNSGFHIGWDCIFRDAIPVSQRAWLVCVNFVLAFISISVIVSRIEGLPRRMSRAREAIWLLAGLYAAYAIHIANAYLYWGAGMSMAAATRGFVCGRLAGFTISSAILTAFLVLLVALSDMKEARMARQIGMTPRPCWGDVAAAVRVGLWWWVLSLVAFELHIAIWFMIS